ncbi:MAG: acetyl-CoA carboxylase carboxyltransferase subunit beta [Oenococcus sp.]|uniref:acetyl-CoA carboxylase carboxyltransferase subunit beta n=1 Tax=Oenococcus TaxID=46254 RepID=UPI0021E8E48B|nr:acetyl-CoA carboxylase carboxyltransferase subunit beta [Oenococcus kitaharae]MCV3296492.1 acetyl-CoA carboxylase carboxyl transferase subunit beta [Oenococcus kitaharae]
MTWFDRLTSFSKQQTDKLLHTYSSQIPSGIIRECPKCHGRFYYRRLGSMEICPDCGYAFRIPARKRLKILSNDVTEWDEDVVSSDPLSFPGYQEKLSKARKATKLNESVWTGRARLNKYLAAVGIMDPFFVMGSLGQATGEKLARLFERATEQKLPVILFTASGGARMQEGIHSLMQMAKITAAVSRHAEAGLLYIVVLTDPTTGGVTASFAMEADITLAEPKALVAFAGRRVIEQTTGGKLPDDFQSVEKLQENGFVDEIVPRQNLTQELESLLALNQQRIWGAAI